MVLGLPVLVALTLVPWYGFTYGYDAYEWLWFVVLISFCELSITAGYHRLWSHSAYKAHPLLKFIFALGGACALQNDCITWAADHRRHHLYADDNERDPYCAHLGFWYAHFGWMIRDYPSTREDYSNVKDLLKDPLLVWQRKHYVVLMLLMNVGVPLLLGYLHGDIWGSLLLLGFLRLVLSQHFTYLINSAAHMWGQRNYDPEQTARDNWLIALFTFGEGYHNYHHTFAWDYRNGIRWYHYDPTKWLIKACSWLNLASDLRKCSSFRVEMTRIAVQYKYALGKCEALADQAHWRERLEHEYQQLVATLTAWSEAQQRWYHIRSEALSNELHHDMEMLQGSYRDLKAQLQKQRARWQEFHQSFGRLHYRTA
jgi:stearoyl-CoA desaturase (delta-9 desaturase)